MVIEVARNKVGMAVAHSSEFDPETPNPVIDLMPDQRDVKKLGGTMRLGVYPCTLEEGTIAHKAYLKLNVLERHRHRFELNNDYREILETGGLHFSGLSPDHRLVEIAELKEHPFMVGTQFHPEFLSRPDRPHPLFSGFMNAAKRVIREGGQPRLWDEKEGRFPNHGPRA